MKKFLSILCAALLAAGCLGFAACGENNGGNQMGTENQGTTPNTPNTPDTPDKPDTPDTPDTPSRNPKAFYIDSAAGNDENDGKTEDGAWKSLKPLASTTIPAGTTVYLNGSFEGPLKFKSEGTEKEPVTFESYNSKKKAVIDGKGASSAVIITDQSNIVLKDLDICNRPAASATAHRTGVYIMATEGVVSGIKILGCDIHDVEGMVTRPDMYSNAGIYIQHMKPGSETNCFKDILIENCTLTDIKGVGIRTTDGYIWKPTDSAMDISPEALNYVFTNVVIRKTKIERTGSDGIILANCYEPLVEDVQCLDAGFWSNVGTEVIAGVWACATYSATFRRVEVARTRFINGDGQPFDTDWGCAGFFTWEYCYTHDNQGGLILRHRPVEGVMRYCISVNDDDPEKTFPSGRLAGPKGLIYFATQDTNHNTKDDEGNTANMEFYNCIFYNDKCEMRIAQAADYDPVDNNWLGSKLYDIDINRFTNCIFACINPASWGVRQKYSNNCYWNMKGNVAAPTFDTAAITGDPHFVGAVPKDDFGYVMDGVDPATFFSLSADSPLISAGKVMENNGGVDYAGNPLYDNSVSIGAFEIK